MKLFKKSEGPDRGGQQFKTPYVVEIEPLLTDIAPEAPSGVDDLSGDPAFVDLEIKIQGTPEREFGGKIVQEAKAPDWSKIQGAACKLLIRTHDLRVAMFLLRALLHTKGIAGLYTGLELLGGFIERFWDSLYPQLDPADNNDPTERINILWALSEGREIIDPLKKASLCSPQPMLRISLRDIHIANGKIAVKDEDRKSALSPAMIEEAFKDCDVKALYSTWDAISQSITSLKRLETLVVEKVGSDQAPDYKKLKTVLGEMATFFEKQLPDRPLPKRPKQKNPQASGHSDGANQKVPATRGVTQTDKSMEIIEGREDVIRMLDQICTYYDQNEPASPVPLLLKRARQLVEKNFIEIMQELAPDSTDRLKTLFGGVADDTS
jgi:type VI secretion system protein ImpA